MFHFGDFHGAHLYVDCFGDEPAGNVEVYSPFENKNRGGFPVKQLVDCLFEVGDRARRCVNLKESAFCDRLHSPRCLQCND